MRKIIICLFFIAFSIGITGNVFAESLSCLLVDEGGNAITTANVGDVVYLRNYYTNSKSRKLKWSLKGNFPTIDSKNYKVSINNSGFFFNEGSSEVENHVVPIAIPSFDYIEGTTTFSFNLSKVGSCYVDLTILPKGQSGISIEAELMGTYANNTNNNSVDAFQDICDPGPPPVYEVMQDHQVTATFTARLIDPDINIPLGNLLYIEKYTIEYMPSIDSFTAPPIAKTTVFGGMMMIPVPTGSGETTLTTSLILINLPQKGKYKEDILSGQYSSGLSYINTYTAIYTFEGQSESGKEFTFQARMDFQIGNFDYCN